MTKFVLLFLINFFILNSHTQTPIEEIDDVIENVATRSRKKDSTYVTYYDQLGLHIYNSYSLSQFSMLNSFKNEIEYANVLSPSFGVGFTKYGLSLNLSKDLKILQQSEEKYGTTKRFLANVNFNLFKHFFNAYASYFEGYYNTNQEFFDPTTNSTTHLKRPDIKTFYYGIENIFILNNEKFSLNAAYTLTQKQLKSVGSILLSYSFNGYHNYADSIINSESNYFIDSTELFNNSRVLSLSFNAGYSQNFVFKKNFNFNVTAKSGILLSSSKLYNNDIKSSTNNTSLKPLINLSAGLAFIHKRYYIGFNAYYKRIWASISDNQILSIKSLQSKLILGYRLK